MLVSVHLSVRAVGRDAILPPLSSKVVKSLIDSGQLLRPLRGLSSSRDPHKPLFISCLYREDGRRLFSEVRREGPAGPLKGGPQRAFFSRQPSPGAFEGREGLGPRTRSKVPLRDGPQVPGDLQGLESGPGGPILWILFSARPAPKPGAAGRAGPALAFRPAVRPPRGSQGRARKDFGDPPQGAERAAGPPRAPRAGPRAMGRASP